MPPHPLKNFEIQKYYKIEPRFNGVFSRNNLPKKIKDGAHVINLDEYADVGKHWIALFCNRNEIVYFNSCGVEHVPEEIKKFIGNKNIKENIFRVQENDLIMFGYFCIGFIDFMLKGKKLPHYTNLLKLLNITKNKKKKHDKILMLAKSKLNSIETLISQALIDMDISHEELVTVLNEKNKYEKMKDNLRSENEINKIMRLSSIKSKI